jgi:nitrogenase-associated protein
VATVSFYQKPGCRTNARQIRALQSAGHDVVAKNLLTEPWTEAALRGFFGETPVAAWFNVAAPRVKSGEINPAASDAAIAIGPMLADPLLIRRPLIEVDGRRCAGFDREPVLSLLADGGSADLQGCSRETTGGYCPPPAGAAPLGARD